MKTKRYSREKKKFEDIPQTVNTVTDEYSAFLRSQSIK